MFITSRRCISFPDLGAIPVRTLAHEGWTNNPIRRYQKLKEAS